MEQEGEEKRRRGKRAKRGPRKKTGEVISIRVTGQEKERLLKQAGGDALSAYMRARLLSGRVPERYVLQQIAALHLIGRSVVALGASADPRLVNRTINAARIAIDTLVGCLDVLDGEEMTPDQLAGCVDVMDDEEIAS